MRETHFVCNFGQLWPISGPSDPCSRPGGEDEGPSGSVLVPCRGFRPGREDGEGWFSVCVWVHADRKTRCVFVCFCVFLCVFVCHSWLILTHVSLTCHFVTSDSRGVVREKSVMRGKRVWKKITRNA